jgi:carotenoid cleavage dioxygenase-like enzyme
MNKNGKDICYNFIRFKSNNNQDKSNHIFENGEIIAQIPTSHKMAHSYFHSFAISENYIIYLEMALVFDFKSFFKGIFFNKSFADSLKMIKDFPTHIHLINRKTGQVVKQKILADPMFVFHHINAYETYDSNKNIREIVIDVCAYDTTFDINRLTYKNTFNENVIETKPLRLVIPMDKLNNNKTKEIYCKIEDINNKLAFEFPVINYDRFNTKPYTYFYGTNVHKFPYSVIKQNVVNKDEMIEFKYEDGNKKFLPSEPIFVERPGATSEDDGVLLVMVLAEDRDFLSILDAKDFKEIARALLPDDIKGSASFHGFFASKQQFTNFS